MNDDDLGMQFARMREEDRSAASPFRLRPAVHRTRSRTWQVVATAASIIVIAGAIGIGTAWGVTTGYASGLLEADRQHATLATTTRGATSGLAALRSDLSLVRAHLGKQAAGAVSVAAVDADLRTIEVNLERMEHDLTRRAAAAAPVARTHDVAMQRAMAFTCSTLGKVVATRADTAGTSLHRIASGTR